MRDACLGIATNNSAIRKATSLTVPGRSLDLPDTILAEQKNVHWQ